MGRIVITILATVFVLWGLGRTMITTRTYLEMIDRYCHQRYSDPEHIGVCYESIMDSATYGLTRGEE